MDWNTILTSLGVSAATGAAIIVFGGKTLVNWWAERGKIRLQKILDEQLETHKADLVRTTNALQERMRIEYGNLYQERLKAIQAIYAELYIIDRCLACIKPLSEIEQTFYNNEYLKSEESIHAIVFHIQNLDKLIGPSLIYFSEQKAEKLVFILDNLNEFKQAIEEWEEASNVGQSSPKKVNKSIEMVKEDADIHYFVDVIRNDFRELIGVGKDGA